jgi:hypothetical protein
MGGDVRSNASLLANFDLVESSGSFTKKAGKKLARRGIEQAAEMGNW